MIECARAAGRVRGWVRQRRGKDEREREHVQERQEGNNGLAATEDACHGGTQRERKDGLRVCMQVMGVYVCRERGRDGARSAEL